jgi:hypothetical protein
MVFTMSMFRGVVLRALAEAMAPSFEHVRAPDA